jgi:hypothetical protein
MVVVTGGMSVDSDISVLGLPGCEMYHRSSIFDWIVPRLLAGEPVRKKDITALGHGGFYAGCAECRIPQCGFGCGKMRNGGEQPTQRR